MKLKNLNTVAWWILVAGGANWGFVGLGNLLGAGNWNILQNLLGSWQGLADILYLVIGGSALWSVWSKVSK